MVGKTKLTLSINEKVRNDAQAVVDERNLTLSRLVENFLKFIIKPNIWCFKCGEKFCIQDVDNCPKCSYLICSSVPHVDVSYPMKPQWLFFILIKYINNS